MTVGEAGLTFVHVDSDKCQMTGRVENIYRAERAAQERIRRARLARLRGSPAVAALPVRIRSRISSTVNRCTSDHETTLMVAEDVHISTGLAIAAVAAQTTETAPLDAGGRVEETSGDAVGDRSAFGGDADFVHGCAGVVVACAVDKNDRCILQSGRAGQWNDTGLGPDGDTTLGVAIVIGLALSEGDEATQGTIGARVGAHGVPDLKSLTLCWVHAEVESDGVGDCAGEGAGVAGRVCQSVCEDEERCVPDGATLSLVARVVGLAIECGELSLVTAIDDEGASVAVDGLICQSSLNSRLWHQQVRCESWQRSWLLSTDV